MTAVETFRPPLAESPTDVIEPPPWPLLKKLVFALVPGVRATSWRTFRPLSGRFSLVSELTTSPSVELAVSSSGVSADT